MHVHKLHIIHEKKQKNISNNLNTETRSQIYKEELKTLILDVSSLFFAYSHTDKTAQRA